VRHPEMAFAHRRRNSLLEIMPPPAVLASIREMKHTCGKASAPDRVNQDDAFP
jgi:hypothetical protein